MTIATAVLAFVTFLLAVAAFTNIRLTQHIQAKERKDRLLREVADWAIDAIKAPSLVETPRVPPELVTFENVATDTFWRNTFLSYLAEEGRHMELVLYSGEYIKNLARHLDRILALAIEDALRTLSEHHDLLADSMGKLSKVSGDLPNEYKLLIASIGQSRQRMQDSAKQIISRATELLATAESMTRSTKKRRRRCV